MGFVKIIKNKAYHKRFQTKFRRRRQGKTDYRARKRLVNQDKNKYNTPKYRLVVRFTNKICICQVVYSELNGDKVICSAYSSELARFGLTVGLKNYSAAYCTGLLLARRLLTTLGMEELYEGTEDADGKVRTTKYGRRTLYVEDLDWETERRPFRCNLDVGIATTTTGARVFGALKGASDGGLDVPHSVKRFPGYDREDKKYDAEEHRARIVGEHVAEYMRHLQENDPEKFEKHFKQYIKAGVEADDLEDLYVSVHEKIRENPSFVAGNEYVPNPKLRLRKKKSLQQRKGRVAQKKKFQKYLEEKKKKEAAAAESSEEEESEEEEEDE